MTETDRNRPPLELGQPGPDHARTGAVWVTGTGAFLLLAAAAVFVAVRWDDIPPAAKLGAVGALTGAFLLAGRRLRPTLPATAGALFHLGAFLVPVDVAALAVRAELGWAETLLAEGLVCGATFALAARAERSVVLQRAAAASVLLAAAGIGAVTSTPAPFVLALAAVAALAARRPGLAVAWAGVAGLAPAAGLALHAGGVATGVLERLGLTGQRPHLAAVVTGLVTAGVLATVARRRLDPALALLASACLVAGVVVTGVEVDASPWAWTVAACTLLATVELVALLLRRDTFWARPTSRAAEVVELVAVPGTVAAAGVLALVPLVVVESRSAAAATALLALTWLVADLRRRIDTDAPAAVGLLLGGRFAPATVGIAACVPASVALGSGSGPLTAVALLATAGVLAAGGRPWAPVAAVLGSTLAPLTVVADRASGLLDAGTGAGPSAGALVGVALAGTAGSLLIARTVSWRRAHDRSTEPIDLVGWCLAAAATVPLGVAALTITAEVGAAGVVLLGTAGIAWLVSAAADAVPARHGERPLGPATATRAASLVLLLTASVALEPVDALLVAALLSALVVVDAVRLDDPRLALGLTVTLPLATTAAGALAALTVPRSGVAVAVAAVVVAGTGAALPRRWHPAALATSTALATGGLALATGEPSAFADALLVTGALLSVSGVVADRRGAIVAGGAALTLGTWGRLVEAGVDVSEPYVAPVAVLLLLAGLRGRERAGSWVTIGPAIALLGGAALAERIGGGGGGHALLAGAIGVGAVVAGGAGRLAAPLVLGTGLLVALAGHESVAVAAGVPTWGWLALGGTILLATGVALERAQVAPLETGRRIVDVLADRYR